VARWEPDSIDLLCVEWARQRRKALGIILGRMIEPSERVGKMRSTLGAVREEGEGAAYSKESQSWPEVYRGDTLIVHRCWSVLPGAWRMVMHLHYVWREIPLKDRCHEARIGFTRYGENLELAKAALYGYLKANGISIAWRK
jgi:hypothetical protein